jgi:hypothetical protein
MFLAKIWEDPGSGGMYEVNYKEDGNFSKKMLKVVFKEC